MKKEEINNTNVASKILNYASFKFQHVDNYELAAFFSHSVSLSGNIDGSKQRLRIQKHTVD